MSPLAFIQWFRQSLHEYGIRFALTSGQACVYFGIQQTTKDSDWIIEPPCFGQLVEMFDEMDRKSGVTVSYRAICGAPLESDYLGQGWTSHLQLIDRNDVVQHLDFFGKAPRVSQIEFDEDGPDFASRHTVAQMKKTDRDKDWPFVFSLGRQAVERGDWRGILHIQDADWLFEHWPEVPELQRQELIKFRPLLRFIDSEPRRLQRAVVMERMLWAGVNRGRYERYATAWKTFFREWRREAGFEWPQKTKFFEQHRSLVEATQRYGLPKNLINDTIKLEIVNFARKATSDVMAATEAEIDDVIPPLEVMLP